jgi:hypothetical protein
MSIAPDLSRLTSPLHLLDKVLAIGWGGYGHWRRVCNEGAAAEGAGKGGRGGEGARVAWLAQGVVTAKDGDWLLDREVEVLVAYFAHHDFIVTSSFTICRKLFGFFLALVNIVRQAYFLLNCFLQGLIRIFNRFLFLFLKLDYGSDVFEEIQALPILVSQVASLQLPAGTQSQHHRRVFI